MILKDKVAIITGGSRGIGKAIALKMAAAGADIVINYRSDSSKELADAVILEIESKGVKALSIKCDVSDYVLSKTIITETLKKFGKIDILVNNAGITKDGLIMSMDDKQFSDVIDVNLNGVFYMIKHVTKPMMKARSGVIINMSSVVGVVGNAGQMNYSASKAGVIGMTKTTARELGKRNIRCNAIAPGFVQTDMTSVLSEEVLAGAKAATQLGTLGTPDDIANAVVFLASDNSKYITGQVLNVCGGMVI